MNAALRRSRVLVVDDDPAALAAIEGILAVDADITACSSPARALDLFKARRFDVVCTDYQMPEMDGFALLREIRRLAKDVGCVLLMGADAFARPGGGGDCYVLSKPYDPQRLVALVTQVGNVARLRSTSV